MLWKMLTHMHICWDMMVLAHGKGCWSWAWKIWKTSSGPWLAELGTLAQDSVQSIRLTTELGLEAFQLGFWVTASLALWAINSGGARPWLRLSTLGMCCLCVCLTLSPLTHLWSIWFISDSEWANIVRCIERLHQVTLGDRVANRWCLLLLEVATS